MVIEPESPSSRSSFDASDSNTRKRVCKACDRCRLKKSKCDGSSPCSRCKADNAICQFGERKRSHDKVYPKGYVELLEQHFSQLTAGLREMYRRTQNGEEWPGEPLALQRDGHPLTHDILQRLDVLHASADCSIPFDGFEESPDRVLDALTRKASLVSTRTNSLSPVTDEPPSPASHPSMFQDSFSRAAPKHARPRSFAAPQFAAPAAVATKAFGPLAQEPMIVDSPMGDALMSTNFSAFSSVDVDFGPIQAMSSVGYLDTNFAFTAQPQWQAAPAQSAPAPVPTAAAAAAATQLPTDQPINWDSWLATG